MSLQKTLIQSGKILISVLLVVVIYRYFFHFSNLASVLNLIAETSFFVFLIAFGATAINWTIESKKWQILASNLEQLSFTTAMRSTYSGATVSNIIPFRMGEYIGRMIFFKPENRIPAAFNSILGSSTQLMASLIFGIPAAAYMLGDKYSSLLWLAVAAALVIPVILWLIFRYFSNHNPNRYLWLQKLTDDVRKFTLKQIITVFLLSCLRYIVFGTFYAWLLMQFIEPLEPATAFAGVATVYLLQSFAPSMVITDAGIRTALPLFVFQVPQSLEAPLLAAALINYAFNILLPSLMGLFFIIAAKVKTR